MAVTRPGGIAMAERGGIAMAEPGGIGVAPDEVVGSDLEGLYRLLARRLERIVRFGVQAPQPLIEDACQFAWVRLIHNQTRVHRETAFQWLVKTASHEALKLMGRGPRVESLDAELDASGQLPARDPRAGPPEIVEQRERLATLASLPVRQQRLLWLYGLGLKYDEIALRDGVSTRTVERQLQMARVRLREAGE